MSLYSVQIVSEKGQNERGNMEYQAETIYLGEDETMMRVRFFDAVRKAASQPRAVSVFVWDDTSIIARVRIEH